MDENSSEPFEFGEPFPSPAADVDRWVGNTARWILDSLFFALYHPPPTRLRPLRRFFSIYSFHIAGIFSFLLLGFGLSFQFHAFLRILVLGLLCLLGTISVYRLFCVVLDVFVRLLNINGLFIDDSDWEIFLYDDFFVQGHLDDDSIDGESLDDWEI